EHFPPRDVHPVAIEEETADEDGDGPDHGPEAGGGGLDVDAVGDNAESGDNRRPQVDGQVGEPEQGADQGEGADAAGHTDASGEELESDEAKPDHEQQEGNAGPDE